LCFIPKWRGNFLDFFPCPSGPSSTLSRENPNSLEFIGGLLFVLSFYFFLLFLTEGDKLFSFPRSLLLATGSPFYFASRSFFVNLFLTVHLIVLPCKVLVFHPTFFWRLVLWNFGRELFDFSFRLYPLFSSGLTLRFCLFPLPPMLLVFSLCSFGLVGHLLCPCLQCFGMCR